jgi:hypothetical protein
MCMQRGRPILSNIVEQGDKYSYLIGWYFSGGG